MLAIRSLTMLLLCSLAKRCTSFRAACSTSRTMAPSRTFGRSVRQHTAIASIAEDKLVEDMIYRIHQCNKIPTEVRASLLPFEVDGCQLGKVRPVIAKLLCDTSQTGQPVFVMKTDGEGKATLSLSEVAGATFDERTSSVATVTKSLKDNGIVTGWRDELYPVAESFSSSPLFLMERAAVSLLGVLEYGVHINGLQQGESENDLKMWIGRRSKSKSKHPGMLDHLVAGGQPSGLSLMDNVIKECEEEAGVPEALVRAGIRPVGAISYEDWSSTKDTISRVVLFNYDLYLPKDFAPKPVDGEVEEFFLWPIDQIKESIDKNYHDPIKPNCYIVIIDFLIRLGYVSPETPGYLDVVRGLKSGDCR